MVPRNISIIQTGRNVPDGGYAIADFDPKKESWVMRWFDSNGVGPATADGTKRQFSDYFTEATDVLFFAHRGNFNNVVEFFGKTEEILETIGTLPFNPPVSSFCAAKTKMGAINDSVMFIEPSEFWLGHPLRRSLFLLLLGIASKYRPEKNDYEHILHASVLDDTFDALTRFLYGFTDFNMEALRKEVFPRRDTERKIKEKLRDLKPGDKKAQELQIRQEIEEEQNVRMSNWNILKNLNDDQLRMVMVAPSYDHTRTLTIEGLWS